MRSLKRTLGLALLILVAPWMAPAIPGGSEVVLLDAPRGSWLASVRAGAALTVVEERDGGRRVRIEGWTAAGEEVPAPSEAPAGAATVAASAPAGATVTGVLVPLPGQKPDTAGAGLMVLLVRDLESVGAEHRALGEECLGGVKSLDARIAEREAAYRKALNSSDNFTAAAKGSDKAKADLAAARRERAESVSRCLGRADDLFGSRAVARAVSDATGRFEFPRIDPGRYWLVAGEHHGDIVRSWWVECRVVSLDAVVLDPRAAKPVGDVYWGLR